MKKIILVGIMFMMFMGVVNASSINGDYKGNPIVKIFSNDGEIKPDDVPALIYNGRTVVPISMLKRIGLGITWNPKDYSVIVETPKSGTSDINFLRLNSKIQNHFYRLESLGESIKELSRSLSLGFDAINMSYKVTETLSSIDTVISDKISQLGVVVTATTSMVQIANDNNINILETKDILKSYSDAIVSYMAARDSLKDYNTSRKDADFNLYLVKSGDAFNTVNSALLKANDGYYKYYNNVQN